MMDLNLADWIERRGRDVGPHADHVVKSVREYEDEIARLREENLRLGLAFHRAINSPKGVVPAGFEDYYEQERSAQ